MIEIYQMNRAFISSPSDVEEERHAAKDSITRLGRVCRDSIGLSLEARTWEDLAPVTPRIPEERIQDILNKEVEQCHFFILILYKRYGTVEKGFTKSNTERELDTILAQFEQKPQLKILAYFRKLLPNNDLGKQEKKVREFRQRLEVKGIMYKSYDSPAEFKNLLTHDLYDAVLRLRLSPYKRNALQRFWRFGQVDPPTHPRLAILFPPVNYDNMGGQEGDELWHKRLHPNVYYEDYKAIHKITKTLAIIGFHDYRTYFQTDPPADLASMNRVWVCFKRCKQAWQKIRAHYRHARFSFNEGKTSYDSMEWLQGNGLPIKIKSPLSLYLREQRSKASSSNPWQHQLGRIVSKDFGILARFRNPAGDDRTVEGYLHDYYVGGIRGLGTWGAGWFLDRRFKHFLTESEEVDLQLLLEVTYHNGRIVEVNNVSDEPPEYFKDLLNKKTIKKTIERYEYK